MVLVYISGKLVGLKACRATNCHSLLCAVNTLNISSIILTKNFLGYNHNVYKEL